MIYEISDLKHYYKNHLALETDHLCITESSITGLAGPNGSGKSTLLKLLAFTEKPTVGKILFHGKPAEPFSESVRFQVSLLPQTPYLLKRTVYENIAYGLKLRNIPKENHQKQVYQAISMVGLDKSFAKRQWYQLSGGEAQRVALAARLVLKPEVLLLDGPTASMDEDSAQLIREISVRACREWGTTLVISNHDKEWLSEVCDTVINMAKGKII